MSPPRWIVVLLALSLCSHTVGRMTYVKWGEVSNKMLIYKTVYDFGNLPPLDPKDWNGPIEYRRKTIKERHERTQAAVGMKPSEMRRERIALNMDPESYNRMAQKRKFDHLKAFGHAATLVAQFQFLWANQKLLARHSNRIKIYATRLEEFAEHFFDVNPESFARNDEVFSSAAYNLAQQPEKTLRSAWKQFGYIETDLWRDMEQLAVVQAWAAMNGVLSMGHGAVSLYELFDTTTSIRDLASLNAVVNVASIAASAYTAYMSVDQFNKASAELSQLAALHVWIQDALKSLDEEMRKRGHELEPTANYRSIPAGYGYLFFMFNVTVVDPLAEISQLCMTMAQDGLKRSKEMVNEWLR